MKIKPFQNDVLNQLFSKYRGGLEKQRAVLKLPTGSGKTYVAAKFILDNYIKNRKSVLWIANRWPHIEHFLSTVNTVIGEHHGINFRVCVIGDHSPIMKTWHFGKPAHNEIDPNIPTIYVSSIQTLGSKRQGTIINRQEQRRELFKICSLFIMDEAHWGAKKDARSEFERLLDINSQISSLALTATPVKVPGYSYEIIGQKYSYLRLANDGELAKSISYSIPTGRTYTINQEGLKPLEAAIIRKKLIASDMGRNKFIAERYKSFKDNFQKTIIFCSSTEQASAIARELSSENFFAHAYHSESLKDKNNKDLLTNFRNLKGPGVLTSVGMLIDGIDIPDLNSIFFTYKTSSDIRFSQAFGRGTRTNGGTKMNFNFVDFNDNILDPNIARILHGDSGFYGDDSFDGDEETKCHDTQVDEDLLDTYFVPDSTETRLAKLIQSFVEVSRAEIQRANTVSYDAFTYQRIVSSLVTNLSTLMYFEFFENRFNSNLKSLAQLIGPSLEWDDISALSSLISELPLAPELNEAVKKSFGKLANSQSNLFQFLDLVEEKGIKLKDIIALIDGDSLTQAA